MPARDEEESVCAAVTHWISAGAAAVIVVDNGSSDATGAQARAAGATVVSEPRRGYGAAAWTGTRHLPSPIRRIVFASADGSDFLDPHSAASFAEAIQRGAHLIVGDRTHRPEARRHLGAIQRFGNALCSRLIALGWKAPIYRDIGSLRLIDREAFDSLALQDRGFGWNIEMQVRAIESRLAITEIPVGYRPRYAGRPKISGSLSGILRAGRDILTMIFRLWWTRRTRSDSISAPSLFRHASTPGGLIQDRR